MTFKGKITINFCLKTVFYVQNILYKILVFRFLSKIGKFSLAASLAANENFYKIPKI